MIGRRSVNGVGIFVFVFLQILYIVYIVYIVYILYIVYIVYILIILMNQLHNSYYFWKWVFSLAFAKDVFKMVVFSVENLTKDSSLKSGQFFRIFIKIFD